MSFICEFASGGIGIGREGPDGLSCCCSIGVDSKKERGTLKLEDSGTENLFK